MLSASSWGLLAELSRLVKACQCLLTCTLALITILTVACISVLTVKALAAFQPPFWQQHLIDKGTIWLFRCNNLSDNLRVSERWFLGRLWRLFWRSALMTSQSSGHWLIAWVYQLIWIMLRWTLWRHIARPVLSIRMLCVFISMSIPTRRSQLQLHY